MGCEVAYACRHQILLGRSGHGSGMNGRAVSRDRSRCIRCWWPVVWGKKCWLSERLRMVVGLWSVWKTGRSTIESRSLRRSICRCRMEGPNWRRMQASRRGMGVGVACVRCRWDRMVHSRWGHHMHCLVVAHDRTDALVCTEIVRVDIQTDRWDSSRIRPDMGRS